MSASKEAESTLPAGVDIFPEVILEANDRYTVLSRDGVGDAAVFPVRGNVAAMSNFVRGLMASFGGAASDGPEDAQLGDEDEEEQKEMIQTIPLPNIRASMLRLALEFCEHYCDVEVMPKIALPLESGNLRGYIPEWYVNYVDRIWAEDPDLLYELILGANYLDIPPLMELTCAKVASTVMNEAGAFAASAAGGAVPALVDEANATVVVSDPESSQFGQPTLPPICECGGVRDGTTCYCARPKHVFKQIRARYKISNKFTKNDVATVKADNQVLLDFLFARRGGPSVLWSGEEGEEGGEEGGGGAAAGGK